MTATLISSRMRTIRWTEVIDYPQTGLKSEILLEDENRQYALICLAMGTQIIEHCYPRNATVNAIEGQGIMTVEDEELVLETGVFIIIPARIHHAVKAISNLSFLLTLSDYDIDY